MTEGSGNDSDSSGTNVTSISISCTAAEASDSSSSADEYTAEPSNVDLESPLPTSMVASGVSLSAARPLMSIVTPAASTTVTVTDTPTATVTPLLPAIIGGAAGAGFLFMLMLLFCGCLICYIRVTRRKTPYKLKEGDTGIVVRKQVADVYVYS